MTTQEERTVFAERLRDVAAATTAHRAHASPLAMHAAWLLDQLGRTAAAEGAILDGEVAVSALALADALAEQVGQPREGAPRALTDLATLYTATAARYPSAAAIEDMDQAVLVLARYVTGALAVDGAPRPYPVTTLARTVAVVEELLRVLAARLGAVDETLRGHEVLPFGLPGSLRMADPDANLFGAVSAIHKWLRFVGEELMELPEPLRKALVGLRDLDHHPAPGGDPAVPGRNLGVRQVVDRGTPGGT